MNVGDKTTFTVVAREFWNDSGIDLVAGATYQFHAQGTWVDFVIPCGPGGYSSLFYQRRLEHSLRLPDVKWFALCGAFDQNNQTAFIIGESCLYPAKQGGRLFCFANDILGWYWNNLLSVRVNVARVS